jgi:hypothetical protein
MPVIVNEFEALAEAPAVSATPHDPSAERDNRVASVEPEELLAALRVLTSRMLRLWAH